MDCKEIETKQPEVIRFFRNAYEKNRIVHAYLFEGNNGSGLLEAAKYFSMLLLCQDKLDHPCFKCNDCQRIMDGTHTNVIMITPENNNISKDKIQDLIHDFSMTSLEGGSQISIINEADLLNQASANALLKFLEEPMDNHYTILITNNKNKILPTILSRVQVIHFHPESESELLLKLSKEGLDLDLAYVISQISTDFEECKRLIEEDVAKNIYVLANKIMKCAFTKENMYVQYFIERNTLLNEDRKWQFYFLNIFLLMFQELLLDDTMHYFKDILPSDTTLDRTKAIHAMDLISECHERIEQNGNLDLQYTNLFIKLNDLKSI